MYVLDIHKALTNLKKQEGVTDTDFGSARETTGIDDPEEFAKFQKFYQIMTAQTMEDIKDISAEEILDLFPKISDYAELFSVDDTFMRTFSTNFCKMKSALRRRIL